MGIQQIDNILSNGRYVVILFETMQRLDPAALGFYTIGAPVVAG